MSRLLSPSLDIVRRLASRAVPLVVVAATACDSASAPMGGAPLSLSFAATPAVPAAIADRASFDIALDDAAHRLVVTSAEVVIDEVELELATAAGECSDDSGHGSDDDLSSSRSGDDCAELESGPVLVSLPLGDGAPTTVPIEVAVPAGTYSELELKLRSLNPSSSEDRAFLAAHPDFAGVTLRVRGTFDDAPFDFATPLDSEVELHFFPALEVGVDGMNITVNLDVSTWFRNADGSLIDPRTAAPGQPNAFVVRANIERSLAVFEDHDHDGQDDHGSHH